MLTCISYTGNESPLSCDQARALGLMELILIAKALEEIRMVLAMSQLKKKMVTERWKQTKQEAECPGQAPTVSRD